MKKIALLVLTVTGISSLSYAQGIIKPAKELATAGKAVKRAVAEGIFKLSEHYHPVLGYQSVKIYIPADEAPIVAWSKPAFYGTLDRRLIQTTPVLRSETEADFLKAFTRGADLSVPQLTEAIYLYRVAHPTIAIPPYKATYSALYETFLAGKANQALGRLPPNKILETEELPNLQFLEQLIKPALVTKSYAELAAIYGAYPKHITLNEEGIPVKTELAETARILDTYLMLSNRKQLGAFNNTKQGANYTPFTLTPEEHAAANELLKSRLQNEQIPANPFADDLIEIAYNRLESHTIPYTQAAEAGAGYKAYPNYKNTPLYRTIQGMIEGQEPDVFIDTYHRILKNDDITHLIVLDAIMGGVELTDLKHAERALRAFEEFTADLEDTPENIAHIRILQQNLRIVFEPYIEYNRNMSPYSIDGADALGWHAHELLERVSAENLVGHNWK